MCLPRLGRVIEVVESEAVVDVGGLRSTVNVMCVPDVAPDDHVMIHAGFAVSILTSAEATERQTLLDAVRTGEPLENGAESRHLGRASH